MFKYNMTLKTFSFLVFIGWISSSNLMAQSLALKAVGTTDDETAVLEALEYQQKFDDFNSLQLEVNSIANSLSHLGYLESKLLDLKKTSDSSFVATYFLGGHYTMARIYVDPDFNTKILKLVSNSIIHNMVLEWMEAKFWLRNYS